MHRTLVAALAIAFCLTTAIAAPEIAISKAPLTQEGVSLVSVVNPAGFALAAPSTWKPLLATPTGSSPPTAAAGLRLSLSSPDGQETLKVSAVKQEIPADRVNELVGFYLQAVIAGVGDLDSAQSYDVAGASTSAMQTARWTDASGRQMVESALAAATGEQIYVLDIAAPAVYASQNAMLIQTIFDSFTIVKPRPPNASGA